MSTTQQKEQSSEPQSPSRSQSVESNDSKHIATGQASEPSNESNRSKEMDKGTQSTGSSSEEEGEVTGNPPLPEGPPPDSTSDGWEAIWDPTHNAYYFYNEFTGETTWTNPRVPEATELPAVSQVAPGTEQPYVDTSQYTPEEYNAYVAAGGAPSDERDFSGLTYYQLQHGITDPSKVTAEDIANSYAQTARFNRFTGKWQMDKKAEDFSDEAKSKRQMTFYFDVDAAANSHDGRSLRAERQQKKLTKKEVKAFKEKRREKKEQKRKAWLKD
ncbi:hypothetical protein BJ508DRAFT_410844 [Ascobolus immersus RN42]|uniref:WW domain-containing protein n=1 Tax=Ascobolus immersus RN42 TaxID=1160509 RepID=A0A3N4INN1_ASCIM|nr:hypothetical protein BJ508DRAFT_410844 [Ascobolus immersus RN42]